MADGWRRVMITAAVAAVTLGGSVPGGCATESPRGVLGTVRVAGDVLAALAEGAWRPLTGGAIVEGMAIRTGAGATALLQFANGDIVGLGENTLLRAEGSGTRPIVKLQRGRLTVHLLGGSPTTVETPRAAVRVSEFGPAAKSGRHEALVAVASGTTVIEAHTGGFDLRGPGEAVSHIDAGQVATLGAHAKAATVTQVTEKKKEAPAEEAATEQAATGEPAAGEEKKEEEGWRGPFGWGPWTTAGVGAGIVAAIGIGIGVAAGGGGGGGDGGGGGSQNGSPFRAPQPAGVSGH
jgi:hypothetical protein